MITLPREPTLSRGSLRAFWLACCLTGAATTSMVPRGRPGRRVGWSVATAAVVAIPGWTRPQLARRPYRAWDRFTHRVADGATTYLAWVTHTTAVPADPAPEYRRPVGDRVGSGWAAASTQSAADHASVHGDARAPRSGWLRVCLALLRGVQDPDVPPSAPLPSGDVYTLY